MLTVRPERSCSPSWREKVRVKGLKAPAFKVLAMPAENAGLNPPLHPVTLKLENGVASGV
jgi:hypothetical protein